MAFFLDPSPLCSSDSTACPAPLHHPITCAVPLPAIVRLLRDLDRQARLQGGAVYMLNGNHESLNVCGDFR
jgi:hypothetical protein